MRWRKRSNQGNEMAWERPPNLEEEWESYNSIRAMWHLPSLRSSSCYVQGDFELPPNAGDVLTEMAATEWSIPDILKPANHVATEPVIYVRHSPPPYHSAICGETVNSSLPLQPAGGSTSAPAARAKQGRLVANCAPHSLLVDASTIQHQAEDLRVHSQQQRGSSSVQSWQQNESHTPLVGLKQQVEGFLPRPWQVNGVSVTILGSPVEVNPVACPVGDSGQPADSTGGTPITKSSRTSKKSSKSAGKCKPNRKRRSRAKHATGVQEQQTVSEAASATTRKVVQAPVENTPAMPGQHEAALMVGNAASLEGQSPAVSDSGAPRELAQPAVPKITITGIKSGNHSVANPATSPISEHPKVPEMKSTPSKQVRESFNTDTKHVQTPVNSLADLGVSLPSEITITQWRYEEPGASQQNVTPTKLVQAPDFATGAPAVAENSETAYGGGEPLVSTSSGSDKVNSSSGMGDASSKSAKATLNEQRREMHAAYPFTCHTCREICRSEEVYKVHHNLYHTDNNPHPRYKCDVCDRLFQNPARFEEHKQSHKRPEHMYYECQICHMPHTSKNSLLGHQKDHTDSLPFVCTICGAKFLVKKRLDDHQRARHWPFMCGVCGKTYRNESWYLVHVVMHRKNAASGQGGGAADLADVLAANMENLTTNLPGGVSNQAGGVSDQAGGVSSSKKGVSNQAGGVSSSKKCVSNQAGGVSSSKKGVSNQAGGVSSSKKGVSDQANVVSNHSNGVSKEAEGVSSQANGVSNQPNGVSNEEGCVSNSANSISTPVDGVSNPADVVSNPADVVSNPANGVSNPANGVSNPADVVSNPANGVSVPTNGVSNPADVVSNPANGVSNPANGVSIPTNGVSNPANGALNQLSKVKLESVEHLMYY